MTRNSVILTIGHSGRSWGEFTQLLVERGVQRLADVRSYPRSARHPHFNRENLRSGLLECGICYRHFPVLGGLRTSGLETSPNQGLPEGGFRNYADHMQSEEFRRAVQELLGEAELLTVLMCAEAEPSRCHRNLLADYLTLVERIRVSHLRGPSRLQPHQLHPRARLHAGRLRYPPLQGSLF